MSGWIVIVLLALVVAGGLWRFGRLRGGSLQFLAAALLVGMAGYAWQGRPELGGEPASARIESERPESAFTALRHEFFGRFTSSERWLILADSYQRRNNSGEAVGAIRAGLRRSPNDPALWIGLGNALVLHGAGTMSPAADYAFRRAAAVAPDHPAPRFFYGMSLIQGGRIEEAQAIWRDLLATAPPGGDWRPIVEQRLAILDQFQAMRQQSATAGEASPPPR